MSNKNESRLFAFIPLFGIAVPEKRQELFDGFFLSKCDDKILERLSESVTESSLYLNLVRPNAVIWFRPEVRDVEAAGAAANVFLGGGSPENYSHAVSSEISGRILDLEDAVTTMRLFQPGIFQRGPLWIIGAYPEGKVEMRIGPGNVQLSQLTGWVGEEEVPTSITDTETYKLGALDVPALIVFHKRLKVVLEKIRGEPKLLLAISSFNRSQSGNSRTKQLLDLTTCLEALVLREDNEITYRLSLRVANLIGTDAENRKKIFADMRTFYNLRSKVIHGEIPKKMLKEQLETIERLREHTRRCALAVLSLYSTDGIGDGFYQRLDDMSLDDSLRTEIRTRSEEFTHVRPTEHSKEKGRDMKSRPCKGELDL